MAMLQLLTTAWTIWKVAAKRVGPVSGFVVTIAVMGGLMYLRPWLVNTFPALEWLIGDTTHKSSALSFLKS